MIRYRNNELTYTAKYVGNLTVLMENYSVIYALAMSVQMLNTAAHVGGV